MSDERLAKEGDALLGRIHTAANAFNSRVRQSISTWLDDHDRALLRAFRDWEIALMNKSSPDYPRLKGEEWCRLSGDDLIDRFLKERCDDTT